MDLVDIDKVLDDLEQLEETSDSSSHSHQKLTTGTGVTTNGSSSTNQPIPACTTIKKDPANDELKTEEEITRRIPPDPAPSASKLKDNAELLLSLANFGQSTTPLASKQPSFVDNNNVQTKFMPYPRIDGSNHLDYHAAPPVPTAVPPTTLVTVADPRNSGLGHQNVIPMFQQSDSNFPSTDLQPVPIPEVHLFQQQPQMEQQQQSQLQPLQYSQAQSVHVPETERQATPILESLSYFPEKKSSAVSLSALQGISGSVEPKEEGRMSAVPIISSPVVSSVTSPPMNPVSSAVIVVSPILPHVNPDVFEIDNQLDELEKEEQTRIRIPDLLVSPNSRNPRSTINGNVSASSLNHSPSLPESTVMVQGNSMNTDAAAMLTTSISTQITSTTSKTFNDVSCAVEPTGFDGVSATTQEFRASVNSDTNIVDTSNDRQGEEIITPLPIEESCTIPVNIKEASMSPTIQSEISDAQSSQEKECIIQEELEAAKIKPDEQSRGDFKEKLLSSPDNVSEDTDLRSPCLESAYTTKTAAANVGELSSPRGQVLPMDDTVWKMGTSAEPIGFKTLDDITGYDISDSELDAYLAGDNDIPGVVRGEHETPVSVTTSANAGSFVKHHTQDNPEINDSIHCVPLVLDMTSSLENSEEFYSPRADMTENKYGRNSDVASFDDVCREEELSNIPIDYSMIEDAPPSYSFEADTTNKVTTSNRNTCVSAVGSPPGEAYSTPPETPYKSASTGSGQSDRQRDSVERQLENMVAEADTTHPVPILRQMQRNSCDFRTMNQHLSAEEEGEVRIDDDEDGDGDYVTLTFPDHQGDHNTDSVVAAASSDDVQDANNDLNYEENMSGGVMAVDSGDSEPTILVPDEVIDESASSPVSPEVDSVEENAEVEQDVAEAMLTPDEIENNETSDTQANGLESGQAALENFGMSPVEGGEEVVEGVTPSAAEDTENSTLPHPPQDGLSVVASTHLFGPTLENFRLTESELQLGKVKPIWIPDPEAPNCMLCEAKFTLVRRRHHCRACGRVLCGDCCNKKSLLVYMEPKGAEQRVCEPCHNTLTRISLYELERAFAEGMSEGNESVCDENSAPESSSGSGEAAAGSASGGAVARVGKGLLKTEASTSGKSVIFSDGVRPGTELAAAVSESGSSPPTAAAAAQSSSGASASGTQISASSSRRSRNTDGSGGRSSRSLRPVSRRVSRAAATSQQEMECFLPKLVAPRGSENGEGPPPEANIQGWDWPFIVAEGLRHKGDPEQLRKQMSDPDSPPVEFSIKRNLTANVKLLKLSCCGAVEVWCVCSQGLRCVAQDEVMVLLERKEGEDKPPFDILRLFNALYEEALQGSRVSEMDHTVVAAISDLHFGPEGFLGSREHAGFLYIRPTFQCLRKLPVPDMPYLVGILITRSEVPWAKVLPMRLYYRLGAEYRVYPCPLISYRFRKPLFDNIGHTIMNLLADFRNYSYSLPLLHGCRVELEDKRTTVLIPKSRHHQILQIIEGAQQQHVLAWATDLSRDADSHLVCIQNESENYHSQTVNIEGKPRKATGTTFVIFNGALKAVGGVQARTSIVEDGVMIQLRPEMMESLVAKLKDETDFLIPLTSGDGAGSSQTSSEGNSPDDTPGTSEQVVEIKWTGDPEGSGLNPGYQSPVDGRKLENLPCLKVSGKIADHSGGSGPHLLRMTELFVINTEIPRDRLEDYQADLLSIGRHVTAAASKALLPYASELAHTGLRSIGIRISLGPDQVEFQSGAGGLSLPDPLMPALDTELVPLLYTKASGQTHSISVELILRVLDL